MISKAHRHALIESASAQIATKIANQVPDLVDGYDDDLGAAPLLYGLGSLFVTLCFDCGIDPAEVLADLGAVTMKCRPVVKIEVES